jgi:phospholipid/cholesterol/gamma-HCH transport system substrate-binding protein
MTRSFGIGLVGITVLALIVVFGMTASSGLPGAPTTEVKAAFTNVGAPLQVGDDVRENSSRIGRVSDLAYTNGQAVVTLSLDGDVPVYADARAAVWDQSALAKKFVELDRGHSAAGPLNGTVIPANRNVNSADLDQVLDVLGPNTRAALASTLVQVGDGMAAHSQDLHDVLEHAPAILTDLGTTSSALAKANLPALLWNARQLAGALNGRSQQLATLVQQLGTTANAIGVDNGKPLRDTINGLPATLTDARTAFEALNRPLDDLQAAVGMIRPGIVALGQATPDLRGVLTEGRNPLDKVPGVSGKAEPAIDALTPALSDARPLAPAVSVALTDLAPPVSTLAAYTSDVVSFFKNIESMVSTSVAPDVHGARVGVAAEGLSMLAGGLIGDPLQGQDAYPPPGRAINERSNSPLGLLPGLSPLNLVYGGGR